MLWLIGGVLEVGTIDPGGAHADPLQELMEEEEFDDIPENGADTGELE